MGDVVRFSRPAAKAARKARAAGKTLCRQGFHKWSLDTKKQFDVKQGKLVNLQRCLRCGATRTTLT